jgi:hypothetical protein
MLPGFAFAAATRSCSVRYGPLDVVRQVADRCVHHPGSGNHEQRVAVRGGVGGELRADDAVRAAAVVDHDLLPDPVGQLQPEIAGEHVVAAAGRERDDQADRAGGVVVGLLLRRGMAPRHQGGEQGQYREYRLLGLHRSPRMVGLRLCCYREEF